MIRHIFFAIAFGILALYPLTSPHPDAALIIGGVVALIACVINIDLAIEKRKGGRTP